MLAQIAYVAFFVVIAESLLNASYLFIKAIWQDIKNIKDIKTLPATSYPAIDIIIYSRNDADEIAKTLKSIQGESYQKTNIIIVDNNSRSDTLFQIRQQIAKRSSLSVRLVAKTKFSTRSQAIDSVLKKYAKSDWVLIINAGAALQKNTLHQANSYFRQNQAAEVLIPNIKIRHADSLFGLLQQVMQNLTLTAKKNLIFNRPGNAAAFYSRQFLRDLNKNQKILLDDTQKLKPASQLAFCDKAVIKISPLPYQSWLAQKFNTRADYEPELLKKIILFTQPFIILYMAYVALIYGAYEYLALAAFSFLVILLINIALDSSLKPLSKLRIALLGIPVYSLYIADALVASLILAVTFSRKKINELRKNRLRRWKTY